VITTLEPSVERQVERQIGSLVEEFGQRHQPQEIVQAGRKELEHLLEQARIADFVPIFVYRFTKERLFEAERASSGESHREGAAA
jgi:hypothetical protein